MGITENEKRRMFSHSVNSARVDPQSNNTMTPMSPFSSKMTGEASAFNAGQSFFKSTARSGRDRQDFKFWQSNEVREQPKKRDDLQRRIAAHYQSIRNGNGAYYQSIAPKNELSHLWSTTPIPTSCRAQNARVIGKRPADGEFTTSIRIRTQMHEDMAHEFKDRLEAMRTSRKPVAPKQHSEMG